MKIQHYRNYGKKCGHYITLFTP